MCAQGFLWWGDAGWVQDRRRPGSPFALSLGQALLFVSFLLQLCLLCQPLTNTRGDARAWVSCIREKPPTSCPPWSFLQRE